VSGELKLRGNTQAMVRMLIAAAAVGALALPPFVAVLSAQLNLELFTPPAHGGIGDGPWAPLVLAGALLAPLLCFVVVLLRQPRGGRIAFDDWGVTEWDGKGVRTAIAMSELRQQMGVTQLARRSGRGAFETAVAGAVLAQRNLPPGKTGPAIGGHLILSDGAGRRIDVTQGVQSATLNDRVTTVDDLRPLLAAVGDRPKGEARRWPRSETLLALGWVPSLLAYPAAALGLFGVFAGHTEPWPPLACTAAGLLVLLRSLAWWVRARRGRDPSGLKRVEIAGGSGTTVKLADGQTLELPKHSDAAIGTRVGEAWLSAKGALETAGVRAARRARRRSNLLAALLRTLMGLALIAAAAPAMLALFKERTQGLDPHVAMTWKTQRTEAVGLALDTKSGLAFVYDGDTAKLIELATGQERLLWTGRCMLPHGALAPGGHHLLVSCDEKEARLWSLDGEPKQLATLKRDFSFDVLAFTGDTAVGGTFSQLGAWRVPSGETVAELDQEDGVKVLTVSPANGQLAGISLYSSATKVWLWGPKLDAPAKRVTDAMGDGQALAFSPDGKLLAVADSSVVTLIEAATLKNVGELKAGGRPNAVAYSPDGKRLVAAVGDALVFFDVPAWPPPLTDKQKPPEKLEASPAGSVPIRWRRGMFDHESDEAAALTWASNDTVWYLARWKGVVLKVHAP
jgi:hypothetical protein